MVSIVALTEVALKPNAHGEVFLPSQEGGGAMKRVLGGQHRVAVLHQQALGGRLAIQQLPGKRPAGQAGGEET